MHTRTHAVVFCVDLTRTTPFRTTRLSLLLSVEDEFSADLLRQFVNDVTDESIEVVAIELSDETEAVLLRRVDGQPVIGERVFAVGWHRNLAFILVSLALDLDVDVEIGDGCEESGDGG